MKFKPFMFVILLFLPMASSLAAFGIGSGFSSSTEGRTLPILYATAGGQSAAISGYSVGSAGKHSYHSAYQLNLFKLFKAGDLLWGDMEAGIGWGVHYYEEGIKLANTQKRSNFATGPSIRVLWKFMGPLFVAFEGMYGLRNLNLIILSSQDVSSLIVGVRF